jgi:hypothetical protein
MLEKAATVITILLFGVGAFSLPRVAVLDSIVAAGIDKTVAVPVTERIIEEFINSKNYTVLDRSYVAQILKEKEFQLSLDIVKNEEMRRAGEYLAGRFDIYDLA